MLTELEIETIARCYKDPGYFIETILEFELTDVQLELLYAQLHNQTTNCIDISFDGTMSGIGIIEQKADVTLWYLFWRFVFGTDTTIVVGVKKNAATNQRIRSLSAYFKFLSDKLPEYIQPKIGWWNIQKIRSNIGNNYLIFSSMDGHEFLRGLNVSIIYLEEFSLLPETTRISVLENVKVALQHKYSQLIVS